jgi:hypothetical protein
MPLDRTDGGGVAQLRSVVCVRDSPLLGIVNFMDHSLTRRYPIAGMTFLNTLLLYHLTLS